jgi:hypothetical protein
MLNLPQKDSGYGKGESITSLLGDTAPSYLETVAARLYALANGGSYTWTETSMLVFLLRNLGHGCDIAAALTSLIVATGGALFIDPPIVGEYNLSRNDTFGDFLLEATFIIWILNAVLGVGSRVVDREDDYPWGTYRRLPELLFNEAKPMLPDATTDQNIVLLWNLIGAAFSIVCVHTLLSQIYIARNAQFSYLFLLLVGYVVLGAFGSVMRCAGPFGTPRGKPRFLSALRCLIVVPLLAIFSVFSVVCSDPWW